MLLGLLPLGLLAFAVDGGSDDDETSVEINGTDDDDRISGEVGSDFLDGEAGDDVLNGRAGNDTIFGRDGDDVLQGEDGDDMLCSGDGDDIISGNRGFDFIEGQEGDDFVSGDYGADTLFGNEGNDTIVGGRGTDDVAGNQGDDLLFSGIINGLPLSLDELEELRDGGSLEDLNGGIEIRDDRFGGRMFGGGGDDDIVIGSGDTVMGGNGDDTFHILSEQTEENFGALINDFTDGEDAITVIVDDIDADNDISVDTDGEDALIRMGDQVLARITGGASTVTADDVTLIAENTVESLFDPNGAAAA
ncbi:hypothetical protein KDD17_07930 [Sulfitobacter albidus]|uniref:Calcium-binding protein n=1 Tax=Sulfitobacter albidus TaxID=2829501 RepID=A0A975JG09_9RHOB|nr:calcium-binding protein [Sulfitobacter albidus]QUJ77851.1 hypothetical protein KDD17_07930 [Sulfitobacter albidus]